MSLGDMLGQGAKIQDIAAHLDGLEPERRLQQVLGLARGDQATLYERAAESPPITWEHFVPANVGALEPVIHEGINSQPLFRRFQKRFCKPADGSPRLFGYNETPVRRFIGPGYFVGRETEAGDDRGAIVVDYFLVPDGDVAPGWPAVVPNSEGLQRFVYHKTRDYMRKVSSHVSIGKAIRTESRTMGYFVLCRGS